MNFRAGLISFNRQLQVNTSTNLRLELSRLDIETRTKKPNKQLNSLSHIFFMKQKSIHTGRFRHFKFPAETATHFFYKNCLRLNKVKNKYIEDMTGRRKDIKFYFRIVKQYFTNERSLLKGVKITI